MTELKGREFNIDKTGDKLSLGSRTLAFVGAPMVHWPDSMFTYVVQDKVLLSNDAFGQHLAHPNRFADEIGEDHCMEEAAKYYANILMPLGNVISKKLDEVAQMGIPILKIGHYPLPKKQIEAFFNTSETILVTEEGLIFMALS